MRIIKKSASLLMILVVVFTLLPLGTKEALAATKDFRPIFPSQQWFFDYDTAVAVDGSGNFYVADTNTHRILKYDPTGVLLENWGPYGTSAGKFYSPGGVAVDSAGNVYVADTSNNRIQKRNASTGAWTIWGSSGSGNKQFNLPGGVATDASGNVYVADTFNYRIQKFDTNGNYLTQWGTNGSEEGQFKFPYDVAVSSNGTVYVADQNNNRIQMFSSTGTPQGMWGEKGSGEGQFNVPASIDIDSNGDVYVLDSSNNRIQKFQSNGSFLQQWGSGGLSDGQFSSPRGIAVDNSGNVYVADTQNKRIQKFTSSGTFQAKWGSFGNNGGELYGPIGLAVDGNGNIYAGDSNKRISKFNSAGAFDKTLGSPGTGDEQFSNMTYMAVDNNGNIYISDIGTNSIKKYDSTGKYVGTPIRGGTNNVTQLWNPMGIAFDHSGNMYVCSSSKYLVLKFDSNYNLVNYWGSGSSGSGNGQFDNMGGIAVDSAGNVYVADANNSRIQKFKFNSTINNYTYDLQWGSGGSTNGQFYSPRGIAIDSHDNVYVGDGNRVQKFSSTGVFQATWGSTGNGAGQFKSIYSLTVDSHDNVYVADTQNHRIQKLVDIYTVAFDSNGGDTVAPITNAVANNTVTLPVAPEKEGYTFAGWYTDNGTFAHEFTASTPVTGDLTVYAKWTAASSNYTVTFESNGGSEVEAISNVAPNTTVTLPEVPSKTGYAFAGWYTDNTSFANEFTGSTPVTGDVTVYAKWNIQTYTVTFNSNGGSTVVPLTGVDYNSTVTLPATPTKAGHIFDGWYTDNGTFAHEFTGSTPVTGNMTVYANWITEAYAVTFNSNGGSVVAPLTEVLYNATVSLPSIPTKAGYTFAGWYTDNTTFAHEFTGSTPVTGDVTVYAKWTAVSPTTYTVSFDSNGGSPVASISNVAANTAITLPATPTKAGHIFEGWYTDDETFAHEFTGSTPVTGNVTVYANWITEAYAVTFNSNGGSAVAPLTEVLYNATVSLPAVPTKAGYTFAGWYTDNGTFAHEFTGLTPVTGNVTVYAKWIAVPSDDEPTTPTTPTIPTPTTVTGDVKDGDTGSTVSNITATVTKDSNNQLSITMPVAQIVIAKQPGGTTTPLVDVAKVTITSEAGAPLTVSADGTLKLSSLAQGTDHHYTISYDFGNGQKINIGTLEIKIDEAGNVVDLSATLIDPYGILTDKTTGEVIAGAKITLYYADTARNKAAGKIPGTLVELPILEGFSPNDNKNPQTSDAYGAYAFMVFPTTDYYLVVTKEGYDEYKSPTISVEHDIVKWDIQMKKSTPTIPSIPTTPTIEGMNRLAGLTQVDTALEIAKATFPGKLSRVVLATADQYPDALAGSVLAYQLDAPILLVGRTASEQQKVLDYLKSNLDKGGEVYILGGTAVVSAEMEVKIKASGFNRITRIGGFDRYETALKIAEYLNVKTGTPIVLAYGESYQDALSISSMAARMGSPIFLVPKEGLSQAMKEAIAKIMPSKVYLIGGTAVISAAVEAQVTQLTALDKTKVVRIAGYDGYETSLAVAKYFNGAGESESICIATGNNFPDALAGSIYAAKYNAPIVLVDNSRLSAGLTEYLKSLKPTGMTVFGGEAVVSNGLEEQLRSLIGQ